MADGRRLALVFTAPSIAHAQVVVIANGSPITEFDIQQRTKLDVSSHKAASAKKSLTN